MTEQRLIEILINNRLSSGYVGYETSETIKEAMKQAVNEAIQECADSLTAIGSVDQNQDLFFKHHKDANKKRILNLKVK